MPIKSTELRIGNWVNDGMNVPGTLVTIHDGGSVRVKDDIDSISAWHIDRISPILLTPEVLEKCGFKKMNNSNEFWTFWKLPNEWWFGQAQHTEPSAGVGTGKYYWGEDYTEVKNLHQLQNLYFALTGNELVYKP